MNKELCRSCTSTTGHYPEMKCTDERASKINYRCPDVWQCDVYSREPGSDDYIGEEADDVRRAA